MPRTRRTTDSATDSTSTSTPDEAAAAPTQEPSTDGAPTPAAAPDEAVQTRDEAAPADGEVLTSDAAADAPPEQVIGEPADDDPDGTPGVVTAADGTVHEGATPPVADEQPAGPPATSEQRDEDATGTALQALVDLQDVRIIELERQLAEAVSRGFVPGEQPAVEQGQPPLIVSGQEPRGEYVLPEDPTEPVIGENSGKGWQVGQTAPADRYGITDSTGATAPTARKGLAVPEPGSYFVTLIREGDVVTAAQRAAIGLDG